MIDTLGKKIVHVCEPHEFWKHFSMAFLPESWRRQACLEDDTHDVTFMHSGDWYCYSCGTYDEPQP